MSPDLLRSLVWMDYRLALLVAVIVPLVLLIWTAFQQATAMQRLLIIYWRVSSLLAITVYLMMGNLPISFLTGLAARVLIPIGLWFWLDLNEEIDEQRSTWLKLVFTSWRWAISAYCVLGALAMLPFLPCGFSPARFAAADCQVWLEPPLALKAIVHPTYTPGFLGFLGIVGLVIYVIYFIYFVFVRLGKQGRSAAEQ